MSLAKGWDIRRFYKYSQDRKMQDLQLATDNEQHTQDDW